MRNKVSAWGIILILLILVGLIANSIMMVKMSKRIETLALCIEKKSLACAAIPTRYVMEEPECADKLLRAMNVTNVHILPRNATVGGMWETKKP